MAEMSSVAEKAIAWLLKLGYHKNERVEARQLKRHLQLIFLSFFFFFKSFSSSTKVEKSTFSRILRNILQLGQKDEH